MSFSMGWKKRDEDGKRFKVQCDLVRTDLTWKMKPARFEQWERFTPDENDWEALLETLDRNYVRGKIKPEDITLVRRLQRDGRA